MRRSLLLILIAHTTVALAPETSWAQQGKRAEGGWVVEETQTQVILRLRSSVPVDVVGYGPVKPELVLTCARSTRAVEALFDIGVKPDSWDYVIRLGQAPAVSYDGKMKDGKGAEVLHQLPLPEAQARAFVVDLVRHPTMVLRFTRDRIRETSYDLRGFDRAVGPFERACGLEADLAAARSAPVTVATASAARSPRESKVGNWEVHEKTSALDDKPVVVLITSARRPDWSQLILRCQESTVEAYVVGGSVIASGNKDSLVVPIAIDGEPAREVSAGMATDRTAFFLPDAPGLVKSLRRAKTFTVRFQRYGAKTPVDATFDVSSLDQALQPFTKACPLD